MLPFSCDAAATRRCVAAMPVQSRPMEGAQQLQVRLRSVRLLLEQTPSSQRPQLAKIQAEALISQAVGAELTKDERASLSALACQVHFPDAILQRVLEAFVPKRPSRRAMQQYIKFLDFLTEGDWSILLNPNTTLSVARATVFTRLSRLGLRLPKEHTMKLVCSLCMFVTTRDRSPEEISMEERKAKLKDFKAEWTKLMASTPDPVIYIESLPDTATAFMQTYVSDLATVAYRNGEIPVACKVDVERLHDFDRASVCRSSAAAALRSFAPAANAHAVPGFTPGQASTMQTSDVMQMFMMQQQNMMQMMFGGSFQGGPLQAGLARDGGQTIPGLTIFQQRQDQDGGNKHVRPGDVLARARTVPSLEEIMLQGQQPPRPDPPAPAGQQLQPEPPLAIAGVHGADGAAGEANGVPAMDSLHSMKAIKDAAAEDMITPPKKYQRRQSVSEVLSTLKASMTKSASGDDDGIDTQEGVRRGRGRPRKAPAACSRVARVRGKGAAAPTAKATAAKKGEAASKGHKAAVKAGAKGATGGKPACHHKVGMPTFAIEWSRNQALARTGLGGPGGSQRFRFGDYSSKEEAIKAARKWVAAEKKRRGLD